ncbi:MAG TPA: cache domain-containing protein [Thermomicrobiales bacterium]|nr:cache domain-containing protein [Thermomicrobiales bacterium]
MGRGWSLRARFVMVAVACLAPLIIVVLFVLYESVGNGRDQLLEAQSATAEVVAKVVAGTLDDNTRALSEIATIDKVRRLDASSAGDVLDQFQRARPSLYGLFLLAPDRSLVVSRGLDPSPFQAVRSFHDSVDRALNLGETGISGKLSAPDAEVIALVVPVRAKDQSGAAPIGAVGALLSADRLKDTVLPFASGDTVIAVVSQTEIIASQGADLQPGDLNGGLALSIADALAGKAGTRAYSDPKNGDQLVAFAPVPGAPWAVLVTYPTPAAYAPNRMLIERALVALGLATLATIFIVLFLGEWIARPLRHLTFQATKLARGDYSMQIAPTGGGEIASLGEAFREMADQLIAKVRALEAAQEEDAAQAEQMRDLNRRTVRLQEDERRRIAGDIHDAVAPLITGALYQTRALELRGAGANGNGQHDATPADVATDLDSIADLLNRATEELHGVVFALRPPDLDDIGVEAAIERYMGQIQRSGLACRLDMDAEPPPMTPEVRLAIYRIVQEALHNALRHGGANEAVVRFEQIGDVLRVSICDNGAGFNPEVAARPTSLGLLSMRERAAAIGAAFSIASRPGDGTTVTIERRMEPQPEPDLDEDGLMVDEAPVPPPVLDEAVRP